MIVLSLFDGISCGQLALRKANIDYDKYFASEIDKNAIKVTQKNFPKTIQIGDVRNVNKKNYDLKIDLLLAGSPCQGFSFAGKQLNFEDQRSKLFFEFVRILEEFNPKYFLLENVKMKKEYRDIISNYTKVEPIEINSSLVSKQNRKRLYWTNIDVQEMPEDRKLYFNKELRRLPHGYIKEEIKLFEKYPSLCAQSPRTKYVLTNGEEISPEDCEEFQTIPRGYTDILNKTNRYKAIGNAWTVDVISHILGYIK